jgi:hypothetical protein
MHFEIVGTIRQVETIATGRAIRDIHRLEEEFGSGRCRKLKGFAIVRLQTGETRSAEIHWYEAPGVGRRKMKIKRYLD